MEPVTVAEEGRKLRRVEKRNAQTPIESKPRWIRNAVKTGPEYEDMRKKVKGASLHTVCQEAGCPNIHECWESREATFLIGGANCSRRCDFCQINSAKPEPLDPEEPQRVAESVREMELNYSTITGVTRDDLEDEGAWLYAEVVRKIHELNPHSSRSSRLSRKSSPTTWRPFRASSSAFALLSATTAPWTSSARHAITG